MNDEKRISTWVADAADDAQDDFDEEFDRDFSIFDYDKGTEGRQELINELNLTHTPEERDGVLNSIDRIIEATRSMYQESE